MCLSRVTNYANPINKNNNYKTNYDKKKCCQWQNSSSISTIGWVHFDRHVLLGGWVLMQVQTPRRQKKTPPPKKAVAVAEVFKSSRYTSHTTWLTGLILGPWRHSHVVTPNWLHSALIFYLNFTFCFCCFIAFPLLSYCPSYCLVLFYFYFSFFVFLYSIIFHLLSFPHLILLGTSSEESIVSSLCFRSDWNDDDATLFQTKSALFLLPIF